MSGSNYVGFDTCRHVREVHPWAQVNIICKGLVALIGLLTTNGQSLIIPRVWCIFKISYKVGCASLLYESFVKHNCWHKSYRIHLDDWTFYITLCTSRKHFQSKNLRLINCRWHWLSSMFCMCLHFVETCDCELKCMKGLVPIYRGWTPSVNKSENMSYGSS